MAYENKAGPLMRLLFAMDTAVPSSPLMHIRMPWFSWGQSDRSPDPKFQLNLSASVYRHQTA
jgi:hypothetical protein